MKISDERFEKLRGEYWLHGISHQEAHDLFQGYEERLTAAETIVTRTRNICEDHCDFRVGAMQAIDEICNLILKTPAEPKEKE